MHQKKSVNTDFFLLVKHFSLNRKARYVTNQKQQKNKFALSELFDPKNNQPILCKCNNFLFKHYLTNKLTGISIKLKEYVNIFIDKNH